MRPGEMGSDYINANFIDVSKPETYSRRLKWCFLYFLWLETKVETVPRNSWQFVVIVSFIGLLPAQSLHSNPSPSPRHVWGFLADGLGTRVCCCGDADKRGGGGKGKKREDLGLVTSVTECSREHEFVLNWLLRSRYSRVELHASEFDATIARRLGGL